ncbi:MAG: hypothetical protein QOD96_5672 [Pseudonocardiales bacterium]|nr:hypothetical protein [Pseudonocardiales bacterium]
MDMLRRRLGGLSLLATAGLLAGCGHAVNAPTAAEASKQVDGVWRSDGYGLVIEVTNGQAQTYETTSLSCMPEKPNPVVSGADPTGAVSFGRHDQPEETLRRTSATQGELRLLGTAADIDLVAIPAIPAACTHPMAKDPLTTFDTFWANLAENYNSTVRKHVDWNALRNTYRPQVNANTTPAQLHQIMINMVQPLGDAHIEISGPDDGDYEGFRPGTRYTDGPGGIKKKAAVTAVDAHLHDLGVRDIRTWGDGNLAYADLPDGRGYLRLTAFQDWDTKPDSYLARQALLDQVLDEVFSDAHVKAWKSLVIDLRYNDGGDDELGLSLAGRMTDRPYTAYTKIARNSPTDPTKYGRARVVTVAPTAGRPHYTGPVRLLTSDLTISAGETFIEAMMQRQPAVTRVGTTTQGVFADNPDRKLPNGWTVSVGNEDYIAPDGRNYEGPGIPPTTTVPVFTPDQLGSHQDPALDLTTTTP